MSHLKQTLHNFYMKILETISTSKQGLKSLGLVPKISVSGES